MLVCECCAHRLYLVVDGRRELEAADAIFHLDDDPLDSPLVAARVAEGVAAVLRAAVLVASVRRGGHDDVGDAVDGAAQAEQRAGTGRRTVHAVRAVTHGTLGCPGGAAAADGDVVAQPAYVPPVAAVPVIL